MATRRPVVPREPPGVRLTQGSTMQPLQWAAELRHLDSSTLKPWAWGASWNGWSFYALDRHGEVTGTDARAPLC